MHAAIASAAMQLGKHVYVQKPLCWSVHEARHLAKLAASTKVVTQMGNQGHSQDGARRGQEYLMSGVIGDIREVHVWTNRPLGYWPQGVPRPAAPAPGAAAPRWNNNGLTTRLANAMAGSFQVPESALVGPVPRRRAVGRLSPGLSPVQLARLGRLGPGRARRHGRAPDRSPGLGPQARPADDRSRPSRRRSTARPIPARRRPTTSSRRGQACRPSSWCGTTAACCRARPAELGELKLLGEGGVLYIGSKGKMLQNTYGAAPRLLPAELHNSTGAPKEQLARIPHQSHEMNWVNAIRGPRGGLVPVLVRVAPDRDHAARRRGAPRQHQAPLRRREHARDQQRRRPTTSSRASTGRGGICSNRAIGQSGNAAIGNRGIGESDNRD